MEFRGYIKDGKVLVDERVNLPNGTEVRVVAKPKRRRIRAGSSARKGRRMRGFSEHYAAVIGTVRGLPPDAARNIDHYLYGAPKRP